MARILDQRMIGRNSWLAIKDVQRSSGQLP